MDEEEEMAQRFSAGLMLSVQALLVAWIGWRACPNKTETGHMAAAVYFWHTLRFDVFEVNPPLTRIISGLPVVLCDPIYDWSSYSSRAQDRSEWEIGRAFIAANSPEKVRRYFALARWSLLPLLLIGGYFGHRLAREMYGLLAGFVFLVLWCFSPLVLAWGATICPDASASALGLVAIYVLRHWLRKPNWTRAVTAGVCLGLLPLAKLTWIIAFALWPSIWCFWSAQTWLTKSDRRSLSLPPFRQLAAILLVGLYTLNMGYLFDGTLRPLGRYVFISQLLRGPEVPADQKAPLAENRFAGTWLGAIPVPLPAEFIQGIDTQRYDFERGVPSYLRGRWADHGWWCYYLYALAIKEPLGTWCLAVLAVAVSIGDVLRRRPGAGARPPSPPAPLPKGEGRSFPAPLPKDEGRLDSALPEDEARFGSTSWRDEMIVLVPLLAILVFVSSQTGFSVHSRYVLPALPLLFVWISKVGRVLERNPHPLPLSQRARGDRSRPLSQRARGVGGWPLFQARRGVGGWPLFQARRGVGGRLFSRRQPVVAALVIVALAWSVASSLSIYPHSLSYFNELAAVLPTPADASYPTPIKENGRDRGILSRIKDVLNAGPRNGPRHLLDSNIDWGQDLYYLEDWYESHPEARPIKVAYFGGYPLDHSKIKSAGVPPIGLNREDIDAKMDPTRFGPLPGWYALSVNEIYSRSQQYRYFLHFEPVVMAGYSIYIYHITLEEANMVRRQLGLPELTRK